MQVQQKSISFYTLGCKLNYSETSTLGRMAEENGFKQIPFQNGADVYVINTCSVTEHADKKCRRVVRQALNHNINAYIVVVGCYAQLKPKEISEIPGVDIVLGAAEKFNLINYLSQLNKKEKGEFISSPVQEVNIYKSAYSIGERTRTFLKVQDGCDYTCSFCTIPLARGKSRSDTVEHVVQMANEIAEKGITEIVLTGVNIGDFGKQHPETKHTETFFDLVKELDTIKGIERFRISSIEPNLLTNEIIEFVSTSNKFVPHFHIPLQSGNNKILKLMRRRYLREVYIDRVETIKKLMPHCCIGVDVITGFPGETQDDFLETYNFLNALDISYLHVFTYSERANTHAIILDGIVPQKIREERTAQLINLSAKKRRYFYEQNIGTTKNVLWEAEHDGENIFGFTENYIRAKTQYDPLLVNTITPVFLKELDATGESVLTEIEDYANY
ncbi:MAG: tRNA (N(6)-L-threonylcarbamoyladenosine(37)-C(2))-methylthiotransferase MtaB [Fimbriimonadaceae bacterium]|nr:tRNA (N(6)-L-threonylcarbamoyladenosine(37)-C(2))-methylthiotransferase MtaB [Chitinophagales bacterium]